MSMTVTMTVTMAVVHGEEQCAIMEECLEEVATPNKLMLSWMLEHMLHITQHVSVM